MSEQNDPLSERELDILRLVATGAANKEIARQLVISPNTVKVHLRNIFVKIGVASRTEATLYAVQTGLVTPGMIPPLVEQPPAEEFLQGEKPVAEDLTPAAATMTIASDTPATSMAHATTVAPSPRQRIAQIVVLSAILVLVLVGSSIAGARLIAPSIASPSAVSPAAVTGPEVQRWSEKTGLPGPRKGMGFIVYNNMFFLFGGETTSGADSAVLRFDPGKNTWETMAPKITAVTDVQAALLGEKIYLPGGRQANGDSLAVLEVYNPRDNTWEQKSPLPVPVSAYALASFEGRLYLFGGKNGDSYLTTVYIYHPEEDRWSEGSPMEAPSAYAGAAVVGGKIHIVGGYDGKNALKTNRAYIPTRDGGGETPWESFAPLEQGRYAMATTNLASTIYMAGGLDENNQAADPLMLRFQVHTNQWSSFESPPRKVGAMPALIASDDFLYVLGGETSDGLSASNQAYQAIYTISVPMLRSNDAE